MRRRPQTNRRRGLLRATVAVVILVIIAIALVLIASSVTAPPVKAPTVPNTPGPITTPATVGTPSALPTARPTAATAHPGATSTKTKASKEVSAATLISRMVRARPANAVASPQGNMLAYFSRRSSAYAKNILTVENVASGARRMIGYGDAFVRPIWSPDAKSLLIVRVSQTRAFPGARWSLVKVSVATGRSSVMARANALALVPLGWSGEAILYMVTSAATSDLWFYEDGHAVFDGIVAPQTIANAALSPNSDYIAFAAPPNCAWCGLEVYNIDNQTLVWGPYGMPNESAIAWTADSRLVVVPSGRRLVAVDAATGNRRYFSAPVNLPVNWSHPMRAVVTPSAVSIFDTVTHAQYRGIRAPTG